MSLYDDLPPPVVTSSTIPSTTSSSLPAISSESSPTIEEKKEKPNIPCEKEILEEDQSQSSENVEVPGKWSLEKKMLAPALRRIAVQKQKPPQNLQTNSRPKKKKKKVINSNILQTSHATSQILIAPMNDDEEYDPMKPNDYEELLEERSKKKEEEINSNFIKQSFQEKKREDTEVDSLAKTTVILLTNMVGPGEVDNELEGEIKEECEKYGQVRECLIFEDKRPHVPEDEIVRIFVKFQSTHGVAEAIQALNGRFFAGRIVQASRFDEGKFQKREFLFSSSSSKEGQIYHGAITPLTEKTQDSCTK